MFFITECQLIISPGKSAEITALFRSSTGAGPGSYPGPETPGWLPVISPELSQSTVLLFPGLKDQR